MWYTMEYYLSITKSEILIHVTIQIYFKNIVLSERNESQKDDTLYDSIYMKCPKQANL